jgi:LPXTG-motif cell wall-anchored protein
MKKQNIRPVGLATVLGGIIGGLLTWWFRKRRKQDNAGTH